jgi:hypothetical protein
MGIEALQYWLIGKLLVHRPEHRKRFPREQRQGRRRGQES